MRRANMIMIGLMLCFISLFGQSENWKGGRIIPMPPIEIKDPVSLQDENVKINITDGVASVIKSQVFKNNSYRSIEGKYIFPIPHNAFINEFSLYIDNERITGEILGAIEAKKIYEDIVRKYRDPALLEMIGSSLFQANIFPFSPHGERKIEVRYTQMMKPASKTYRLLYPLGKTNKDEGSKVSLDIELNNSSPFTNIYSPSHNITVESISDKKAKIKVSISKSGSPSDFILYYSLTQKNIETMSLIYDDGKENPYFMFQLSPRLNIEQKVIKQKNVVFVLDVSGSMMGKKIEQAKKALIFCMKNLNKSDRYSLITFSNNAELNIDNNSASNETALENSIKKIGSIEADGGTNLNQAMELALKNVKQGHPNYVIVLTDGLPTVGTKNPDEIEKNIKKNYVGNARIFCFGVGNDVDAFLLDKIAEDYNGSANYIRENEDMENEVSDFFAKISNPVLTDIKIDYGKLDVYDVYPKTLPDLFVNGSIMVFGRLKSKNNSEITLSGNTESSRKNYNYLINTDDNTKLHTFIPKLWANRKIAFMLDEIRSNGENKELVDEIIKLSKKFGIITPYTSYLVKEDERKTFSMDQPVIKKNQIYDAASGYTPLSSREKDAMVSQSVQLGKMKSAEKEEAYESLKSIDGKLFRLQDEYWVEVDFDDSKCSAVNEIEFASDKYFSLLENEPELRNILALSDRIKFIFKEKCYIIK